MISTYLNFSLVICVIITKNYGKLRIKSNVKVAYKLDFY